MMVAPRRTPSPKLFRYGWPHISQEWPHTMKRAADREGWHLWRYKDGELEVRKNHGPTSAFELVQAKAHAGSIVAQKALALIVKQKLGLNVFEGEADA